MSDTRSKSVDDNKDKGPPPFESSLPMARPPAPGSKEEELDLDVDSIESRLPYGSEDIADK